MATDPQVLQVGRIGRAHGLRGEVVVKLTTNRLERVAVGAVLNTGDRELVVESSRPHDVNFLVRFAGVVDRTEAEALAGAELYADAIDDADELWVHELVGAAVVDQTGTERGQVVEVEANPASDLLVLDTGALVPTLFISSVDAGRIEVEAPAGLFDMT